MLLHKAYPQTNLEQIPENGKKKTKTFSNKAAKHWDWASLSGTNEGEKSSDLLRPLIRWGLDVFTLNHQDGCEK